jgi:hypothetical protein
MDSALFDQDDESRNAKESSLSDSGNDVSLSDEELRPVKKLKQSFKNDKSDFFADLD